jgi:hypothetical protein
MESQTAEENRQKESLSEFDCGRPYLRILLHPLLYDGVGSEREGLIFSRFFRIELLPEDDQPSYGSRMV